MDRQWHPLSSGKSLPKLTTGPIADLDEENLQKRPEELWVTGGLYFFGGMSDLMTSEIANHRVSEFFRQKIREPPATGHRSRSCRGPPGTARSLPI
jgi:hypothetical protein